MLKIVFLCSGGGGNLRFIHHAISANWIENVEICAVITDRECAAKTFAIKKNIWTAQIDFSENEQQQLHKKLDSLNPDLIITNVHKILSKKLVKRFSNVLLNLHYSLLPAFGGVIGMTPVNLALEYGMQFIGATVHMVDENVDTGKPVVQAVIPIRKNDTIENLMDIVFRAGCVALLNGIEIARQDRMQDFIDDTDCVTLANRIVMINPMIAAFADYQNESFWVQLKLSVS